jgi:hypothetical protein
MRFERETIWKNSEKRQPSWKISDCFEAEEVGYFDSCSKKCKYTFEEDEIKIFEG